MSTILLVDADPLSFRVLDVSLRAAGFDVLIARDKTGALARAAANAPDVVVTDTQLHDGDGFALVKELRQAADRHDLPAIFVANRETPEDVERARELGADGVLGKPTFVREILARVHLLLARRAQRAASASPLAAHDGLRGATQDLALVDLLQSLEASRTTGVIHLDRGASDARIYLRDGNVVDAELGRLRGAEVVHRTLTWDDASFRVEPGPVDNDDLLECTTHALLLRSMDRLDGLTLAPEDAALEAETAASSPEQSIPSTAPWTREAGSTSAVTPEADLTAAGLPFAMNRTIRRVGLAAASVGAVALLAGLLSSVRSQQAHVEAHTATAAAATPPAADPGTAPPSAPPAAERDKTAATPEPETTPAPAAVEATAAAPALATQASGNTTTPQALVSSAAPPSLEGAAASAALASLATTAAPAPATVSPGERALDVRTELHAKSPLVRDADRALLKGDTARATALAQQATAANMADAEAWLTLAAARKASGDAAGARDAYAKCIADARTVGVMSCRALVTKSP